MAGNRRAFDKRMKKAAGYAAKKSWSKAIQEYNRALAEFPTELPALVGLGVAYAGAGELESARIIFQDLRSILPENVEVLSHLAAVEERLGDKETSAALFMELAALHEKQDELDRAVDAWAHVVHIHPTMLEAHRKLAHAYHELGERQKAAAAYVALASALQAEQRTEEAVQNLQVALKLDPDNEDARSLLGSVQAVQRSEERLEDGRSSGPVAAVRRAAWAELARVLFEDISLDMMSDTDVVPEDERYSVGDAEAIQMGRSEVIAVLGHAVDADSKGETREAIHAYQQVLRAGVDRVAIHFAIGLLYKLEGSLEEACRHLSVTTFHPDYALASHLALGECYQSHGKLDLAIKHFLLALQVADLQTVDETRAEEIIALYSSLIDGYQYEGALHREEVIVEFIRSVRELFRDHSWLERARKWRALLDGLSVHGVTLSLAEGMGVGGFDDMLTALAEIQHLVDSGMALTAREECYRAIEKNPTYLPLHLQLADIFVRQGLLEDAVSKYLTIAEVYLVWGNPVQAANVYRLILSMAPLDVKVRSKLIDLLVNQKEIEQALEQYLALADAYYQLARVDKALEKFNEALRLARRSSSEKAWRLKILSFMADLYTQKVEWDKAVKTYEEILTVDPTDDQAALQLMDLHFKQGRAEQAMSELQKLLDRYKADGRRDKVIEVLREAVQQYPGEMSLRARLSQAYLEQNLKQEAIVELDALGEMQLEAGMRDQAIQTIRLIISLEPANVKAYKQLLYHLLG